MLPANPVLIATLIATLTGCTALTTPYVRPDLPPARGWEGQSAQARAVDPEWWKTFGNPDINALVATALANNSDIVAASLRARRAVLQSDQSRLKLGPVFSGSGGTATSANLADGSVGATSYSLTLGASYEVDLWGKAASADAGSKLEAMASIEDIEAARVTVIASVIETYFRLGAINQQIAQAETSLAVAGQTMAFVEAQTALGAGSALNRNEALQAVAAQKAGLTDLMQSRVALRSALSVLLNGAPNPAKEPVSIMARTPVIVSPGLPADLLLNRPDIRAAELRLRATLKGVDGARASLMPGLSLTGSLGSGSTDLADLLANPVAALGSGITLPFLNLREGQLNVKVSRVQYEEAVVAFRKTLLTAFEEVSVALSARRNLATKAGHLTAALEAAREAENLTERRYKAGAEPLRVLLDAQERRRSAEGAVTANRLEQLQNEVLLFRVLGTSPVAVVAPG